MALLINNAGYGALGPLAELPMNELRLQFETNVFGLVALVQALLPDMVRQRSGRIINISSVSGVLPTPFAGAYCATKAAVNALSDSLRMELQPFGIEVMTVQPGGVVGPAFVVRITAKPSTGSYRTPFLTRIRRDQQRMTGCGQKRTYTD